MLSIESCAPSPRKLGGTIREMQLYRVITHFLLHPTLLFTEFKGTCASGDEIGLAGKEKKNMDKWRMEMSEA